MPPGNNHRKRVFAYTKQDRLIINSAENTTNWAASTDVSNLTTSTNHREGSSSISFDKDGATEAFGQITLSPAASLNLVDYLDGKLRFWVYMSALTDVASVDILIGESASANYRYNTADTELSAGWNLITVDIATPTATTGDGAAWSSIDYIAIKVNLDAAGDNLTGILVDAVSVLYESSVNIENVNLSATGLATSANQTAVKNTVGDGNSVSGDTAHDAVDAGEPVKVGYQAADIDNIPAQVANADRVNALGTRSGDKYTYERFLKPGADSGNDIQKVEQRGESQAVIAADTAIVTGSGLLRNITFAQGDAVPTAGSIIVYDNTAESGTVLYSETFTTDAFRGYTVQLNVPYGTGLYVGFTTTADVNVTLDRRDDA